MSNSVRKIARLKFKPSLNFVAQKSHQVRHNGKSSAVAGVAAMTTGPQIRDKIQAWVPTDIGRSSSSDRNAQGADAQPRDSLPDRTLLQLTRFSEESNWPEPGSFITKDPGGEYVRFADVHDLVVNLFAEQTLHPVPDPDLAIRKMANDYITNIILRAGSAEIFELQAMLTGRARYVPVGLTNNSDAPIDSAITDTQRFELFFSSVLLEGSGIEPTPQQAKVKLEFSLNENYPRTIVDIRKMIDTAIKLT